MRKEVLKGISWMSLLRITNRLLAIFRIAILARILNPGQFGVFAIGTLVLGFLEIATGTGVNVFLIQEKERFKEFLNSAWAVSIIRGIGISLITILISPLIASFFNTPESVRILLLISIVPFVRGFVNPAVIRFQKDLEFNKEFYKESSLFVIETVFAVTLGILTRSEDSLVYAMIIAAVSEVIISFLLIKPTPHLKIEWAKVKKVIDVGKWVTGAGIFDYLFHHLDDMVVGRVLGTAPLGLYQQAYKVSSLPVSETAEIFNKVTFPVYSKISEEGERLKFAFLRTTGVIAALVIPFGILLFIFSKEVVLITLGSKWLEAEPVLRVLVIYGVLKALNNSTFSLFLALKMQKIVTLTTLVNISGLVITIIPLVNMFGIVGAGYSTIIGTLLGIPFSVYYLVKVLKKQ